MHMNELNKLIELHFEIELHHDFHLISKKPISKTNQHPQRTCAVKFCRDSLKTLTSLIKKQDRNVSSRRFTEGSKCF